MKNDAKMLYKLFVEQGSHQLAYLIEKGMEVFVSKDKIFYLKSSSVEVQELAIEDLLEIQSVEIPNLEKLGKPNSVMGLWAYYLALSKNGKD